MRVERTAWQVKMHTIAEILRQLFLSFAKHAEVLPDQLQSSIDDVAFVLPHARRIAISTAVVWCMVKLPFSTF